MPAYVVRARRIKLGIRPLRWAGQRHARTGEEKARLGTVRDGVLAAELGLTRAVVNARRRYAATAPYPDEERVTSTKVVLLRITEEEHAALFAAAKSARRPASRVAGALVTPADRAPRAKARGAAGFLLYVVGCWASSSLNAILGPLAIAGAISNP